MGNISSEICYRNCSMAEPSGSLGSDIFQTQRCDKHRHPLPSTWQVWDVCWWGKCKYWEV